MTRTLPFLALLAASCASHSPASAPPPSSHYAPDLASSVAALARETAQIRGLAFTREVPVAVQSPAEITAHLRAELLDDRDAIADERRIAVALGEIPPETDLVDALSRFIGAEASGYYDPDASRLVLTTTEAAAIDSPAPDGAEARATVVHELTHALQHQHFENRVGNSSEPHARTPEGDHARARLALLEGDATLVALEWSARRGGRHLLGASDMAARLERWAAGAQVLTEVNVPTYLIESAEFPYEAGALGVGGLYAAGGWARVNSALENTALRAAEVLHPERTGASFVEVEPAGEDAMAAYGARRVFAGALGEAELRLLLARGMAGERAAQIAATWRGDAIAVFEGEGGVGCVWRIACEDGVGARVVADALRAMAERWVRDGCPGIVGGDARRCPSSVAAAGAMVVVTRGGR